MNAASRDGENAGRDPEIVRAEAAIARTRDEVGLKVVALQREIARTLDWREWIADRPFLAVALAFGVGALLGGLRPRTSNRST